MATGHENRDNQQSATMQGAAGADWDSLKSEVGDAAGAAMDQGRHLLDSARDQATGFVDQRKNAIAESVVGLANQLRESGGALEDRPQIRAVVDRAVGGLEQLADGIRDRSVADMIGDVEDLVRRRPAVAAVATMAAGFLLARFVKASTSGQWTSGGQGQQSGAAQGWQAPQPGASQASPRGQMGA
jgi:hypothetical protein